MPRFCANLSLLFTEVPLPERFDAARRAGFEAVEIQFPYAFDANELADRAAAAGVEVVLINFPPGNWDAGDRGIGCLPGRISEFRDSVRSAMAYARALKVPRLNCLAGIAPLKSSEAALRETYVSNLRFAAEALAEQQLELLIEAQNTRSFPRVFLRNTLQALAIIDEVRAANLKLQYDVFHMQVMEGDIAKTLEAHIARIGHIQVADVPDRHEPGTGELGFPFLFDWIDRLGYTGWIGAEYIPSGVTQASLGWARPYLHA